LFMSHRPNYAVVVSLEVEPAWLALPRAERRRHAEQVAAIVARHPKVSFRWFDADAFGHGYTDFALTECDDLEHHHFLWEELRDLPLFSAPYLRVCDTMLGMERGYQRYEAQAQER